MQIMHMKRAFKQKYTMVVPVILHLLILFMYAEMQKTREEMMIRPVQVRIPKVLVKHA